MKFISLRSFLAMIFLLSAGNLHAQGSCMVLYDDFWSCSANSFMANTPIVMKQMLDGQLLIALQIFATYLPKMVGLHHNI